MKDDIIKYQKSTCIAMQFTCDLKMKLQRAHGAHGLCSVEHRSWLSKHVLS